ncbi:peptidoglycan DD-metalloendopeptidase family protein [Siminovitchia sediminis]|uniref:Peptidoglycan DD-metalloendopeptidase family protein n=1 Tax=Siminovitchia sediminis TaxID=1274353 RepID=A0ABW4KIM4_9BACI
MNRWIMAGLLVSIIWFYVEEISIAAGLEDRIQTATGSWVVPADGVVSDVFSSRGGTHKGMDIAGALHSPVYAVEEGKVIKSYYSDTYGHVVFLKHSYGFVTVYAHLQKRDVLQGATVKKGEVIGSMGSTGNSTGSHLHFEVHFGDWTVTKENAVDPFAIFGNALIGEQVYALQPSLNQTAEAVASPRQLDKYIVQKGDTVWSISRKHGTTVEKLAELNGLNEDNIIVVNQTLILKE